MKRIIPALIITLTLTVLASCNEKPRNYELIINTMDGKQKVEKLTAKDDTAALKLYLDRMTKSVLEETEKDTTSIQSMFIVSPDGDTLNTNQELLLKVVEPTTGNEAPIQVKKVKLPTEEKKN